MASDFTKPDQVHTLWQNEIQEKMWKLPVRDLFFVGNASEKKLKKLGIYTIGELANTDIELLKSHLKSHGVLLHQYANGIGESEVITVPPENKGYGNSLTTARDVYTAELAKQCLLSLAETVSARLRSDGVKIKVVSVGMRDYDLKYASHQSNLCSATDLTRDIYQAACRCFDELWEGIPIRHLGIHTSHVTKESVYQINLFDKVDYDKLKSVERTVDVLRKKYGQDVVKRAVFLMPREKSDIYIDHMGGGISREKRTVDYEKEIIL